MWVIVKHSTQDEHEVMLVPTRDNMFKNTNDKFLKWFVHYAIKMFGFYVGKN